MSELLLEQTSDALLDYLLDRGIQPGVHGTTQTQIGGKGRVISDVAVDPFNFDINAVDPFAIDTLVTNETYMTRTIPDKVLQVSVIVHADEANDHPGIIQAKRALASTMMSTIETSLPDRRDRMFGYIMGSNLAGSEDHSMEELDYTGDVVVDAATIAQICQDGLAFVIGDFRKLRFSQAQRSLLPAAVAIKVNHPFERQLPPYGDWTMADGKVVKAKKPDQLAKANNSLETFHVSQVRALQIAGFAVASIITDPTNRQYGLNETLADTAVAAAIRAVKS